MDDAAQLFEHLGLAPHPEGGHYRETWRDTPPDGARGAGSAIYFLLRAGEESRWHRVDAAEIWHYYAGAPLALEIVQHEHERRTLILGPDVLAGQAPQQLVPPGAWQRAASRGAFTLVGCT